LAAAGLVSLVAVHEFQRLLGLWDLGHGGARRRSAGAPAAIPPAAPGCQHFDREAVLGQVAQPGFLKAELLLDDPERVLAF
jgi:hypothetical protein